MIMIIKILARTVLVLHGLSQVFFKSLTLIVQLTKSRKRRRAPFETDWHRFISKYILLRPWEGRCQANVKACDLLVWNVERKLMVSVEKILKQINFNLVNFNEKNFRPLFWKVLKCFTCNSIVHMHTNLNFSTSEKMHQLLKKSYHKRGILHDLWLVTTFSD